MTRAEKYDILRTIENEIEREKRFCNNYVKLNPADKERRERDRENVIFGLQLAWNDINQMAKID